MFIAEGGYSFVLMFRNKDCRLAKREVTSE